MVWTRFLFFFTFHGTWDQKIYFEIPEFEKKLEINFGMEISRDDCIRYKVESKMLTEFIFFTL